ncbi:Hypothetical predicted protein [Olea europaea subsp. europaea]|uniref:Uncharacterized protein n=1 Tax=Olea europaea subsp. europaea TaxID=158383 RepID=A0A8S0QCW2_OLEEU|nr:Hypothetical predicted protein [Olea europaea subsp. europaea]
MTSLLRCDLFNDVIELFGLMIDERIGYDECFFRCIWYLERSKSRAKSDYENAYSPVLDVADSYRAGVATNVIFGLALGYK